MNSSLFSGRIGNELVLKKTKEGISVVVFSLAVRRNKEETDWIRCVAYREKAEFIERYFKKGSFIEIRSKLRVDVTDETPKRYFHNFIVMEAEFGGSSGSNDSSKENTAVANEPIPDDEGHTLDISSDDLPF